MDKFWFIYHAMNNSMADVASADVYCRVYHPMKVECDLIAAALVDPKDEVPWLILADNLEETGQEDEAEVIRAQFTKVYTEDGGYGYLPTVKLAAYLRKKLKRKFPTVKQWWVRSRSYSMGSSIDVYYEDGSNVDKESVYQYLQRYTGSDFDGMTDLKSSRHCKVIYERRCYQVLTDYIFAYNEIPYDVEEKRKLKGAVLCQSSS